MADTSPKAEFAKAAVVIYAPDAASQEAARAAKELIEKGGGKVEIRNQNPPWSYAGIH